MPYGVYSTRFLVTNVPGQWIGWTVPLGKRAIIRSVLCKNPGGASSSYAVSVAGLVILEATIQASEQTKHFDLRYVVYAGEHMDAITTASGSAISLNGYLFDDPLTLRRDKPEAEPVPPPEGWEAPAQLPRCA